MAVQVQAVTHDDLDNELMPLVSLIYRTGRNGQQGAASYMTPDRKIQADLSLYIEDRRAFEAAGINWNALADKGFMPLVDASVITVLTAGGRRIKELRLNGKVFCIRECAR